MSTLHRGSKVSSLDLMQQTWADEQEAMLRSYYPELDIWYVPLYVGGQAWCAKPKGERCSTIQVSTPEELVAAIAAAQGS